jgi:NurA domain-containing protein
VIYRDRILAALDSRSEDFARFESELREQYAVYGEALDQITSISRKELESRLDSSTAPGALPTEEFYRSGLVIPFLNQWRSHEEARQWAYATLLGRTTFAADGSQIMPTKDYSVPVAAVQVGWFENPHTPGGHYVKDARFEILTPAEIMVRAGGDTDFSRRVVERRRYGLEIDAIRNFMQRAAARGFAASTPPVVFLDGLLVISFAEMLPDDLRDQYLLDITSLLDTSKKTAVPVVGYIDTSFARDLVNMLQAALGLADSPKLQDAGLVAPRMHWGARSPVFCCARRGILDLYTEDWRRGVGFVYLKTSSDASPSRLDVPMWVYERGLLDYVLDTVRAEVIVGNGYPYPIEAADATAVLGARDRETFYGIFQEFAERERFSLRIARKAISKAHRR